MYEIVSSKPFGAIILGGHGASLFGIDRERLIKDLSANHVLILRGYQPTNDDDYTAFCQSLGDIMMWEFGAILELRKEIAPKNHIFSGGRVELHWDGAYTPRTPRINAFQCIFSSDDDAGGETLFSNTRSVLNQAASSELEQWKHIKLRYSTEKKAHFGGTIEVPLVDEHPHWGGPILRFIEPKNEDNMDVNPVTVEVLTDQGDRMEDPDNLLDDLVQRFYRPEHLYAHQWRTGDYVLVDNNSVLHGRAKVKGNVKRHLKRVHIL